jgi:hypothetical protein
MSVSAIEALEPRALFSALTPSADRLLFNDPKGGAASAAQVVTLTNNSTAPITIPAGGITLTGASAARFQLTNAPVTPFVLSPGSSIGVSVDFNPTVIGPQAADLLIQSDDPITPVLDVTLRGLGTLGLFGGNEPSLQWILDTYQIPVHVGDSKPSDSELNQPPTTPNDEVPMMMMQEATPGPVTVQPIAVFSNAATPALGFGYYTYTSSGAITSQDEFTVPSPDVQTINPHLDGNSSFDPGSSIFGLYTRWPAYANRLVYTEDFRNTWQTNAKLRHNVRFYPMKNTDGSLVPNTYVMAVEEALNHDFQDGVFIVSNITPAPLYEAESAKISGAIVASANPGFTGAGYVDFQHDTKDFVEWDVNATAGTHTLTFRYSNGGATDRPLELKVNGIVVQAKLSFLSTGTWSMWSTVSISVPLGSGLNSIRLTAIGFNGANFDSLTIA